MICGGKSSWENVKMPSKPSSMNNISSGIWLYFAQKSIAYKVAVRLRGLTPLS
jgi:hypothetical protein